MLLLTLFLVLALGYDYKWSVSASRLPEVQFTSNEKYLYFGRSKRYVQLTENEELEQFEPCQLPSGDAGHCKRIRQCKGMSVKNMMYPDYFCIIEGRTLGICCPEEDIQNLGLAGDLPATALKDEDGDALLRIARAENRGCGLSTRPHGRLTGARPANPREWPWIAFVAPQGYVQWCGGALITDRHVLTAAHCTKNYNASELIVRLGEYDISRTNESRTYTFRVIEKRDHENFEFSTYQHDITILKLHRPAVFNTYVWPICLPPIGLQLVDQLATVIGWGAISYGGPISDVLMEVTVPVWDHDECVNSYTERVHNETICAGGKEGGKDSCQGDSGGPLMYQLPSGRWASIGIVSWGYNCGDASHPGLYTSVEKHLSWIVQNVIF